jgi:hypothetical protein
MFRAPPHGHPYAIPSWWSSTGLPGSWGVLSCLCPALRPRPRLPCDANPATRCCPRTQKNEGRSIQQIFEALSHGFSTHCLRFQLRFPYTGKTRFRWVASPYRMGFEPIGLQSEFHVWWFLHTIPTLQAWPGAIRVSARDLSLLFSSPA